MTPLRLAHRRSGRTAPPPAQQWHNAQNTTLHIQRARSLVRGHFKDDNEPSLPNRTSVLILRTPTFERVCPLAPRLGSNGHALQQYLQKQPRILRTLAIQRDA